LINSFYFRFSQFVNKGLDKPAIGCFVNFPFKQLLVATIESVATSRRTSESALLLFLLDLRAAFSGAAQIPFSARP